MFGSLRKSSKVVVYIVVAAFIVTGGLMGFGAYMNKGATSSAGVSSPVIASVNNEQITQQEYLAALRNQAPQSSQLGNFEIIPFRLRVLNSMIDRQLLLQQAEEKGIKAEVTDQDVEDLINQILESNDMKQDELVSRLEEQGSSLSDFKQSIRQSLELNDRIQKTIEKSYNHITVSDEDVKKEFEDNSDKYQDKTFDEVKEDIKNSLLQARQNEVFNNWMENVRADADITINDPVLKGYNALTNENYETAISTFKNVVQNNPSAVMYTYLAEAYSGNENKEQAVKTYQTAVEKYPDDWEVYLNFGNLYQQMEDKDKALAQYKLASEKAGEDFMAHYQLYMAYSQMGAEEQAQSEMELLNQIRDKMQKQQEELQKQQEQQQTQQQTQKQDQTQQQEQQQDQTQQQTQTEQQSNNGNKN